MHSLPRALAAIGSAVLLALAACAPADFGTYQATIGDFRAATDQTSAVTSGYLSELNLFERRVELARLRADPQRPLDIEGRLMATPFDPQAIAVRRQAFAVLNEYTDLLAALAGSDAGERWKQNVATLRANADALAATVGNVTGTDFGSAAAYSGPASALLAFLGEEYLNMRRAEALDAAILRAKPQIDAISALLREDMDTVRRQRETAMNEPILALYEQYERVRALPESAGRETLRAKVLDDLEAALADMEREQRALAQIGPTLDGFDAAHAALAEYAASDKGPDSLAELVAAVKIYSARARALYDAIRG